MESYDILKQLPQALLCWYDAHKRDLPWRQDRDPYRVWVSEIMLQQTRVEAVKPYYARFLQALPTVQDLAKADDELLHKLWEGLGYYSRARNLKKAAQVIVTAYGGVFPREYDRVLALPGIGEYTAGAILSICFDQPRAAVDGNVLRVVSRLLDDPSPIDAPPVKKAARLALEGIYPSRAGDFTQALMELGATVCGPNTLPACHLCPCSGFCRGHQRGTAASLPVKSPKRKRRAEEMTVLILRCDGRYALRKRPDTGLLAGMWEFPHIPGKPDIAGVMEQVEQMGLKPKEILRQVEKKHIFTHIEWDMSGVYMETGNTGGELEWFTPGQIGGALALPTAFRRFWEERDYV